MSPWRRDWTVGVRTSIERNGQTVLCDDSAELLIAIGRLNSITAAAKQIGVSYRHAWTIVQTVNDAAGEALVACAVGGLKGGGAGLTEQGRIAVEAFERLRAAVPPAASGALQRLTAPPESTVPVHLAVAISLQDAIGQLLADFALVQPTVRVRAVFGASNELADHLLAGAPGDLFIPADAAHFDRLEAAGLLLKSGRRTLAYNALAIIGSRGSACKVRRFQDLCGRDVRRIALAEPACPVGSLAQAHLEKIGLLESVKSKLMYVDNAGAVLTAVESGRAELGLGYVSDAAAHRCQILLSCKDPTASVKYVAALLGKDRPSSDPARAVLDFFCSDGGAKIFRRCGLRVPKRKNG